MSATETPSECTHLILGGGVNGLSVAWHLAERIGGEGEILVVEKDRIGAGASGLAGGIVRNYYRAPAITELIRDSVEIFEAEPEAFGFRQVGYLAAVPERQVDDLVAIRSHHEAAGYESELITGPESCREYLTWTWPDWTAPVAAVLHERRGGWADAMETVRHLAERARSAGARIAEGVEVLGFEERDGRVVAAETSRGRIACETLVIAPGPWASGVWEMLGRSPWLEVAGPAGDATQDDGPGGGAAQGDAPGSGAGPSVRRLLLAYLKAQEGEFQLPGVGLGGRAGREPPVVHLDQETPLRSDRDGRALTDGPWGIYFRMGRTGTGITGGGLPLRLEDPELDPYGAGNPAHAAEPEFGEFFVSGLATAFGRFRGQAGGWRATPGGGIVSHTPDNYPICDWIGPNAYAVIDSGHGFKILALGRHAASDLLEGEPRLDPFRLARFASGETHTASAGPYPWT
ncbi:MAG: FAD-binding oxidoreductase [Solirubrobacterales bacterium]